VVALDPGLQAWTDLLAHPDNMLSLGNHNILILEKNKLSLHETYFWLNNNMNGFNPEGF
jgi:hypothetical protein